MVTLCTEVQHIKCHNFSQVAYDKYANNESPTVEELLVAVKATEVGFVGGVTSLRKVLWKLGFKWRKLNNRIILMEKRDIAAKRIAFLRRMRDNFSSPNPRPVVWMDETWIFQNSTPTHGWQDKTPKSCIGGPASDGTRFVVIHAGSEEGFVEEAGQLFSSGKQTGDYHGQMDGTTFISWLRTKLLPKLRPGTLVVMDNAPYHSVCTEEID